MRHTFSRRFLEESGDLVMLNRLLGHRRLETTAIYTQPTLDEMAEALSTVTVRFASGHVERFQAPSVAAAQEARRRIQAGETVRADDRFELWPGVEISARETVHVSIIGPGIAWSWSAQDDRAWVDARSH